MSWFGRSKELSSLSEADQREARRQKLEQERQLRTQQRAQRQAQLQAVIKAQEEADQALKEVLEIDPNIFNEDQEKVSISEEEINSLLSDSSSVSMAEFQSIDGKDGEKAMENLRSVVCPFDKEDIVFWFSELEGQLEMIDIQSQWLKRGALQRFLPMEIKQDIKEYLKLTRNEAGNDIYLKMKNELLKLYGPKPEDSYNRAKNRVMTGVPSQLGKALLNDLCDKPKKLAGCCCSKIVWGMFREQLPVTVRNHVAELTFDKDTYTKVFDKADQVYASNQGGDPTNVGRSVAAASITTSPEVAAMSVKNRSNKGQSQGKNQSQGQAKNQFQTVQNQSQTQRKKHPTAKGDDDKLCKIHFKFGVNATFCASPWKCPMKEILKTPTPK